MSDLSQALLEAAAAADWQAHNVAVLKAVGKRGSLEEKRRAISRARSRAAVAAVLETLADGRMVMSDEFLRRLAAEVKGQRGVT